MLRPVLLTTLRGYDRRQATADVVAGVIVGVVALPLSIAFAIASGLPPEHGLYTAVIAGFLISALGGSHVQIGGPTGAFIVIVYGIVQQYGVAGLTVATMMAGVMLVIMGITRMGAAIKFIPYPVTTGFTSGIAIVIFSSQVRDLLGLRMAEVPVEFVEKWRAYAAAIPTANLSAVALAATALFILIAWPHVSRRIPAPLIAIVVPTLIASSLHLDVETIGTRFGEIRAGFPAPAFPDVTMPMLRGLLAPAFTIALLAAVESLLSAVVADGMVGTRHKSNAELVAQGAANFVSPMFGGMPATGAIARTATNIRSGGRTPVAGMVHALTILVVTLFLGRLAALIPLSALAAVLVMVAYHMSEWRSVRAELGAPPGDLAVLLCTLLLTVLVDLTVAIIAGIVLAAFLFMRRMAAVSEVHTLEREMHDPADTAADAAFAGTGKGIVLYAINGPFFFGAAEKFKEAFGTIDNPPKVVVLRMRNVPVIDSTGIHAFRSLVRRFTADGTLVLTAELEAQPLAALNRAKVFEEVGEETLYGTVEEALAAAREHVEALAILEK
ncbi:MAG TPA: SulP family inorganic anion transporter [Longimicrobiales bacterium]